MSEHVVEVMRKSGLWRVVEGAFIMSSHADRSDALEEGARRVSGGGRLLLRDVDGSVEDVTRRTADDQASSPS